jgi:hypothetical protein
MDPHEPTFLLKTTLLIYNSRGLIRLHPGFFQNNRLIHLLVRHLSLELSLIRSCYCESKSGNCHIRGKAAVP